MTTSQPDRLDRIEALLEQFIAASASDRASSNERMISLEQTMERQSQASNERMMRLEQMSEKTDARFNQLAEQQASMLSEADANREITFMMLEQMTTAQEHITALQEQSKQILDYLFGQQRNGKDDQPQP